MRRRATSSPTMGAKWDLVKQRLLSIQRRLGIAPELADQEVQAMAESAKEDPSGASLSGTRTRPAEPKALGDSLALRQVN